MLTFAAEGLPLGATFDTSTGQFQWTPIPGQVGEHHVLITVTDGMATASEAVLIAAAIDPSPPQVHIELTPSFPSIPGQQVLVHVTATSLADIASLALFVDGQLVNLDQNGRATLPSTTPGRQHLEAVATDLDSLVGEATKTLFVRDPTDSTAPVVNLESQLAYAKITSPRPLIGTVQDINLDNWRLAITPLGSDDSDTLAQGNQNVSSAELATLDPQALSNGFYRLTLTAHDMRGRHSTAETVIEVFSEEKPGAYQRNEVDLSVALGGATIELVRSYDATLHREQGSFGHGWRLANQEVLIQSSVPPTDDHSAAYHPLGDGSRVYATMPDGDRVGFTFRPVAQQLPGDTLSTTLGS